jgi:uncharacterized repeat protein (TIGR01451 family)
MKTTAKAIALVLLGVAASHALAQDAGHLNIETVVQKEQVVVDDAGNRQTHLVDADTVVPGDEVIYTVSFANVSDEPAENVIITNPLPEQLSYVEGSAFGPGANVEFSVDGGKNFAAAEELMVSEDGNERSAAAGDFTHVRWVMINVIEPGSQGMAQFRARLN